jgi:predicted AlkP superfamily phosphohydrolase/phosphomutase
MLPRLPERAQQRFWAHFERTIPFARSHVQYSTQPDFSRTVSYPGSPHSGLIYLNVRGREPSGVIRPEDRRAVAVKLAAELGKVEEPDSGTPLFRRIWLAEELYQGPATDLGPDLIVDRYQSDWNIRTRQLAPRKASQRDRYFVTFEHGADFGWHSPDGIFIFSGPAFCAGSPVINGSLLDVAPTLLHLYGVPLPEDWDGRVMAEVLAPELGQKPVSYQPGDEVAEPIKGSSYSAEEDDLVLKQLRALGYVD